MTADGRCPECGKPLPPDRVPGKCPACLLRAGLESGSAAGPLHGSHSLDRQVSFSFESAHVGKVLETLAHSIGSIPRVLLPDTETNHDATAVVKPLSSEMPSPAERGDRYQLFGEIARGGMGAILKGRDADLGRDLAFKVLLESHQGKPDLLRRFVEEAQIGGQLQHPGIVPVYELGTFNDQRPYFTMKLVKGRTLASLLHERKTPDDDLPRFLGIFEQVCQTVAYAHARAVIHRDLKPTNVMVGSFGEVQVMDWGLAKVLRDGGAAEDGRAEPAPVQVSVIQTVRSGSTVNDSQAGSVLGTPAYMSPEQAGGAIEQVDRRADVFGLGSILCEILTGQPAYTGRVSGEVMRKAARGDTTDALARLHASGADGELVSLARSCLAVEAIDRPRDAGQVADAILAYQNSVVERLRRAEVERAAEQVRAVEERRRHRMSLALAASVLALVLLGGGGAFWLVQDRRARQAKLDLALQGAELLQNQALATREGAVEKWQAALLAVEKAAGVLGTMPTDEARARLAVLEESVRRGIAQATADEQLVTRLDQIRATVDGKQADAAYAEAFRAASLDISAPQAMRERLAARPAAVREAVVTALDAWSVVRSDEAGSKRVLNAARAIDSDDPWHNQLRDALERKDLQGFRRLAQRAQELAKQGPVSLWLLGHSLEVLEDHDLAVEVLRWGQQAFPGDYWLNLELGVALLEGKRQSADTASTVVWIEGDLERFRAADPYLTAAVALRPRFAPARIVLGMAFARQGRWQEAVAAARQAIALDPSYAMAHNDLGLYLAKQDKPQEALAELQLALKLDPQNTDAANNIGWLLAQQGKFDQALAAFRAGLAADAKNVLLRTKIADILRKQDKLDLAVSELREALVLEPTNGMARFGLRLALEAQGKLEEATEAQREYITLAPKNPSAHLFLGDALEAQGKHNEAAAAYRQAIAVNAGEPWPHHNLAKILRDRGQRDEGIIEFRTAFALDPSNPAFRQDLYDALRSQGRLADAMEVVRDAVGRYPRQAEAHRALANALRDLDQQKEAIAEYKKAIELDANLPWTFSDMGRTYRELGKLDLALAACRRAVALAPKEPWIHHGLADVLYARSQTDEAIDEYRKAIDLNAQLDWPHQNLGLVLLEVGEPDAALVEFRKCVELQPTSGQFRGRVAHTLAKLGRLDEAEVECRETIARQAKHPRPHFGLGSILRERGRLDEAAAEFRKAEALAPANAPIRAQLQQVERMIAAQDKLPSFLAGDFRPKTAEEQLGLAGLCRIQKRYAAAAEFYAAAFATDPKLAEDVLAGDRRLAAGVAALAGTGQGEDASELDAKARARLRQQSLDWMRADLAIGSQLLATGKDFDRTILAEALRDLRIDPDLAGVRGAEALSKLGDEEQHAWRAFWDQITLLLKDARHAPLKDSSAASTNPPAG